MFWTNSYYRYYVHDKNENLIGGSHSYDGAISIIINRSEPGLKIFDRTLSKYIMPKYNIMAEDGHIIGYTSDFKEAEALADKNNAYVLDNYHGETKIFNERS
jgi:hypothetical protein